jgi:hypothetical protein
MEAAKYANPETEGLAAKFEDKLKKYHHWPCKKKQGEKLIVFTESDELVFLLADIAIHDKWEEYPDFVNKYHQGFAATIHILIRYVLNQKPRSQEAVTALERITDNACTVALRNEFDNRYYMLRCLFALYKREESFPQELFKRFDAVPCDHLRFYAFPDHETSTIVSIYGSISNYIPKDYEVGAYSRFTGGDIKIPQTYNGLPVTKIAWRGFTESRIKSIEIPEGIEEIDRNAFSCTNIKTIKLPQSLKRIRELAFFGCPKLTEITIPQGVSEIEHDIFRLSKVKKIIVQGHSEKPAGWHEDWNKHCSEKYIDVTWGEES